MLISFAFASGDDYEDYTESCDLNELPQIKDLMNIVKGSSCDDQDGNKKCRCIQKVIRNDNKRNKEGKNSDPRTGRGQDVFLVDKIDVAYDEYQKMVDARRGKYLEQYSKVYKIMTVQSSAQEQILGMSSPDGKVVGCTPELMADGIRKKTSASIPAQVLALEELKKEALDKHSICDNLGLFNARFKMQSLGCDYYLNRSEMLGKNIEKLKEKETGAETVSNNIATCKVAVNAFFNDKAKNEMKAVTEYYTNPANMTEENNKEMLTQIQLLTGKAPDSTELKRMLNMAQFWNDYTNSSATFEALVEKYKPKCNEVMSSYNMIRTTYDNIKSRDVVGEAIPSFTPVQLSAKTQCDPNDAICAGFAMNNEELLKDAEKLLAPKAPDDCLTYAEYITFMGMPSEDLLKEFANTKDPEKLLDDNSSWFSKGASKDKLKFLQSNPVIAQIAKSSKGNESLRSELGKSLKKMAKDILSNKDKSNASKLDAYLKYMKDENDGFKSIYQKSKNASKMAVCDSLQQSFAAITLANDLEGSTSSNPNVSNVDNKVLQCVGKLYDKTSTSDLDSTLKLSEIYSLGNDVDKSIPSEDGFKTFKEANCTEINNYKADGCDNKSNKKCAKEDIRGIKKTLAANEIPSSFDKKRFEGLSAPMDKTKEYKEYKEFWYKEIGSKINQNSLATKNDGGAYAATVAKNQAIMSSPDIESRYEQYMNPTASANSSIAESVAPTSNNLATPEQGGFTRSSEDKNQVRPEFTTNQSLATPTSVPNFSSIPKETFQKSNEITDLDPVFDKKTDEEKLSTFKALEEFKEESGTSPDFKTAQAIKDLEEKIANKTQEINNSDKNKVEANKTAQSSGQVGNFRNLASVINPPISNAPMLSQFPRTSPTPSSDKNKTKAQASYEAALLNMGTGQIVIQANNAEGPFEVAEIITADDSEGVYPFKNLKNPDVLSEFLAFKVGDKIKTGESIKIKDPNSNDYFVIKATKKDGVTAYQLIPFVEKEVIRISTRASLKHALNPKY